MVIECLYNTNNTDVTTNTDTTTNTTYTNTISSTYTNNTNTTYPTTYTTTITTYSGGDSRPIMDSLMDQNILPGVGAWYNIYVYIAYICVYSISCVLY